MLNFMCSVRNLKDILEPRKSLLKLDLDEIVFTPIEMMMGRLKISIHKRTWSLCVYQTERINNNFVIDIGLE